MKLSCAVAADLLPLYAEKMTSAETNALVEEHLRECPACRKRLEELQTPAVLPPDLVGIHGDGSDPDVIFHDPIH